MKMKWCTLLFSKWRLFNQARSSCLAFWLEDLSRHTNYNRPLLCVLCFAVLLQSNIKANQEKFIKEITQPGGPVDKAREYLNANKILTPPQV